MSQPAKKLNGHGERLRIGDNSKAKIIRDVRMKERARLAGVYNVTCWETEEVSFSDRVQEIGYTKTIAERFAHFARMGLKGIWQRMAVFNEEMTHRFKVRVKWTKQAENRVVNEGLNSALDVHLSGATQITTWYLGLTDGTPTDAAGDTLASHAGWTEVMGYTGTRKTWTDGGVSSQSVDNVGNEAQFAITGTATVGGCFLCSVTSGTAGTLYSVGAFAGGDEAVNNGDTLEVTYTATAADA